jgi:hypothetical protein
VRLSSTAAGDGSPEAPHTAAAAETRCKIIFKAEMLKAVLWIRIRIPDPDADPSIITKKKVRKTLISTAC